MNLLIYKGNNKQTNIHTDILAYYDIDYLDLIRDVDNKIQHMLDNAFSLAESDIRHRVLSSNICPLIM